MKTQNKAKILLAGAAMAGLLGGAAIRVQAAQTTAGTTSVSAGKLLADDTSTDKHSCKGQNSCKGQGFKALSAKKCTAAGGSLTAPN